MLFRCLSFVAALAVAGQVQGDYASSVLQSQPSAYYRFEETSGNAMPSVAGGAQGTINGTVNRGVPSASSALGACYRFNNGAVVLPFTQATQPGAEWSIELWAKVDTVSNPAHLIGNGADLATSSHRFVVYGATGSEQPWRIGGSLVYQGGPGGAAADAWWESSASRLTAWHHYVYVHSAAAGTARFYVDGQLSMSLPLPSGSYVPNTAPFYIGKHLLTGSYTYPFFGLIDEVAVYKRALPAAEILAHFEAGSGTILSVPGNYPTIQAAIDSRPAGELWTINVAPGTYAGPINLSGKPIRLIGTGGAAVTTISGTAGQSQSVIRAISGESAISLIKGFTIRGGPTGTPLPSLPSASCGGGILVFNAQTSIENCIFTANEAPFGGGAYLLGHGGSITNCTFNANISQGYGGGLQLFDCSTTITGCTFPGNIAVTAGAGMHMVCNTPRLVICTITGNDCNDQGGGISWDPVNPGSQLLLQQTSITGNIADVIGGGIYVYPSGVASETQLVGTTVCSNAVRNISGPYQADAASQICDCRADLNSDSVVNGVDLAIILSNWGTASTTADLTGDGTVSGSDLAIILAAWGNCPSN